MLSKTDIRSDGGEIMAKIKLAVLFGGSSSEHSVSLVSATTVLRSLDPEQYDIIPIGITDKGRWLFYPGPYEDLENDNWLQCPDNVPCILSPDRQVHGLVKFIGEGEITLQRIDCVFPVLHGRNGEDGTIQGLAALAGIPCVGCDLLSSAVCMDKDLTHTVLTQAGIKNAPWQVVHHANDESFESIKTRLEEKLHYPMFVKPANAGSSVGINRVDGPEYLQDAIQIAMAHDPKVVIEAMITGSEVECAVLGNEHPVVSVPGEITPCNTFYDYEAKYLSNSGLTIPARLDAELTAKVRAVAKAAYQALGCRGMARVDSFVNKETGEIVVNEINTIPGFTGISMYPKLFAASGMSYSTLLDELIALAMEN